MELLRHSDIEYYRRESAPQPSLPFDPEEVAEGASIPSVGMQEIRTAFRAFGDRKHPARQPCIAESLQSLGHEIEPSRGMQPWSGAAPGCGCTDILADLIASAADAGPGDKDAGRRRECTGEALHYSGGEPPPSRVRHAEPSRPGGRQRQAVGCSYARISSPFGHDQRIARVTGSRVHEHFRTVDLSREDHSRGLLTRCAAPAPDLQKTSSRQRYVGAASRSPADLQDLHSKAHGASWHSRLANSSASSSPTGRKAGRDLAMSDP